jgi:hypothetical protein
MLTHRAGTWGGAELAISLPIPCALAMRRLIGAQRAVSTLPGLYLQKILRIYGIYFSYA